MRPTPLAVFCRFAIIGLLLAVGAAHGQVTDWDADLADRPISEVRIEGAAPEDEQLIRNNLRAAVGDPFDAATVRGDMARLNDLARFQLLRAETELARDGSVIVIYIVQPQPLVLEVQTIGNKAVSDQELLAIVQLARGGPRDDYLIEKAKRDIEALYRRKGFYLTTVSIDESELQERGLLIFRVIEGPRVRVKAIEFSGADAFDAKLLRGQVKTRTHWFFLRQGVLDEDVLASDVAALDRFYKDRGYIDVRVDRAVQLSPDNKEAKVTFLIDEGRQYTLRSVRAEKLDRPGEPLEVFSPEQIAALLEIKTGDVFSQDKLRTSIDNVKEAYETMGYLDVADPNQRRGVRVDFHVLRTPEPQVDLLLVVDEGRPYKVGLIRINGNFLTKDKVFRRLIRLKPGRPFDMIELAESERRIRHTRLVNDVRITIQDPDPDDPAYRDVLVEIKERNTGSVNFGIAFGSDSGAFGELSLRQDNFDIADFPASFQEFITGRAFRGAGQRFSMVFRPGNEIFQYSVSLTEPHLFESDYALGVAGSFRQRRFRAFDEERLAGSMSLTRELGDVWQIGGRVRSERVQLTEIDSDAPTELFLDAGPDNLTSVGLTLTRTTIGTITRPGEGSRLELSLDWFGALGGDFDFGKARGEYSVFLTLDEDFLGRRSILKLTAQAGYIFGDRAPTYERFYLGGRSFRGFEFRTISPKGIRADTGEVGDDPVGGNWLLFLGAQYEFPLFQETVTGVLFLDTGTVTEDFGLDDYRVSIGTGVRLYIPQLGPVPIAFDFGFPIRDVEGDESRVLTFFAELPF